MSSQVRKEYKSDKSIFFLPKNASWQVISVGCWPRTQYQHWNWNRIMEEVKLLTSTARRWAAWFWSLEITACSLFENYIWNCKIYSDFLTDWSQFQSNKTEYIFVVSWTRFKLFYCSLQPHSQLIDQLLNSNTPSNVHVCVHNLNCSIPVHIWTKKKERSFRINIHGHRMKHRHEINRQYTRKKHIYLGSFHRTMVQQVPHHLNMACRIRIQYNVCTRWITYLNASHFHNFRNPNH
jgi:hypothetical protein